MYKWLIVNADDFAFSPAVARGILDAHREGIVTSSSAMMNLPWSQEWVNLASKECDLGLGLHLVFTAGAPLSPSSQVPSLVDESGGFRGWEQQLALREEIDLGELEGEWRAQVEAFQRAAGRYPDHLDGHHFVFLWPPFFRLYLEVAVELGVPVRAPLSAEVAPEELLSDLDVDRRMLVEKGVAHPDRFICDFYDQTVQMETLRRILEGLDEGISELMCHPGYVDEELTKIDHYTSPREEELRLLCAPEVPSRIEALGIQLVNYKILSDEVWG